MNAVPSMHTPVAGEPVELQVSSDMVKRGLIAAPALILAGFVIWGTDGAWSTAYAIALVLVNFLLSALLIGWAARISLVALMAATMFGYVFRLGLIFLAVFVVKDASWISLPAVGAAIIVTHLGLLVWELRYISISLAYPGLKPSPPTSTIVSPNP